MSDLKMEDESNNSHMMCFSSTVDSEWVAQNVQGVNQSVDCMLKIIQEDDESAADTYHQKRSQLASLIEGVNQKHQLLAAQCDLFIGVLHSKGLATPVQNFGQKRKLDMQKIEGQMVSFDSTPSSGSSRSGFEVSVNTGSGFSSLLSSDSSDTDSFNLSGEKHANSKLDNPGEMSIEEVLKRENTLSGNEQKLSMIMDEYANGITMVRGDADIGYLVSKIVECEKEISRLKNNALVTMHNGDIPLQNDDLEAKGRLVPEVQMQVKDSNSNIGMDVLLKELEITKEKLKASEDEVARLKTSFSSDIHQSTCQLQSQLELYEKEMNLLKASLASEKSWASELQGNITGYTTDTAVWEFETSKLTASLQDALRNSEAEKAQLLSHNAVLSANMIRLEARYAESEVKVKLLEREIKNCEALKEEIKDLHQAQEMQWHKMQECLKAELNEKNRNLEALNKNFDGLKLKFDMLMAEKDGLNAKLQTLHAELCSKDNKIQQSEYQLHQLQLQNAELNASTDNVFKQRDELRLKVEELEKELKWQAVMISDRAEEKKEAIRQLCFSLEHYRSGYQELRKAYSGKWRRAVTAS